MLKTRILLIAGTTALLTSIFGCASPESNIPDEIRHIDAKPGQAINTAPGVKATPAPSDSGQIHAPGAPAKSGL